MGTEDKLIIQGGRKLEGHVNISGSKNAALAIIPATLLVDGEVRIENVPRIADVEVLFDALRQLGARVEMLEENTVLIDGRKIREYRAPFEYLNKLRASYYLVGALLGKSHHAEVCYPGGCNFGSRPIDQHIKGFEALGASVEVSGGLIRARAKKLTGNHIYFDKTTVGGTVNVMLAAVKAEGVTVMENAAREPHIVDVANFLNMMGADIKGAGTNMIRIRGTKNIPGGKTYSVVPDMIEAGTYMIAAAATRGNLTVNNIIPEHMESLTAKLTEAGIILEGGDDFIRVQGVKKPKPINVQTLPYPGFPTDLHPQMVSLLCTADGQSTITEGIHETRFQYAEQLMLMGADIRVQGGSAIVTGVPRLSGAPIKAGDLRAAACLVLAGLVAEGKTTVSNIHYLDRGYERFVEKIEKLGAHVTREE